MLHVSQQGPTPAFHPTRGRSHSHPASRNKFIRNFHCSGRTCIFIYSSLPGINLLMHYLSLSRFIITIIHYFLTNVKFGGDNRYRTDSIRTFLSLWTIALYAHHAIPVIWWRTRESNPTVRRLAKASRLPQSVPRCVWYFGMESNHHIGAYKTPASYQSATEA